MSVESVYKMIENEMQMRVAVASSIVAARITDRLTETEGLPPSRVGEYPHKQTGKLAESVDEEFDSDGLGVSIGPNIFYAPILVTMGRKMTSDALAEVESEVMDTLGAK